MESRLTIEALNGSPHAGAGNTAWLAISRGELDGQTAFMNGKFTV